MSARRAKSGKAGFFKEDIHDVIRDGHVMIFRNPAGHRFNDRRDATCIDFTWQTPDEIPAALEKALAEERVRARAEPPAWDSAFGYLSADPTNCGNGLYINSILHLEALNLLGDLKCTLAGLDAVRLEAWGFNAEFIHDTAHLYRIENRFSIGLTPEALAKRVGAIFRHLAEQEMNARRHLVEVDKVVFADAVIRALAIIKFARLISPWELTDMLSPIRMAAAMGFIDGITKEEIDDFTFHQFDEPPDACETGEQIRARDKRDATFAKRMNRRFAHVALNARAKEILDL